MLHRIPRETPLAIRAYKLYYNPNIPFLSSPGCTALHGRLARRIAVMLFPALLLVFSAVFAGDVSLFSVLELSKHKFFPDPKPPTRAAALPVIHIAPLAGCLLALSRPSLFAVAIFVVFALLFLLWMGLFLS
jgi:hypothetical protein